MRDDEDRGAGRVELPDEPHDRCAGTAVEVPGRLIGEHDRRTPDERPGDRNPLPLPSGRATFKPAKLSGGERQRVAIARALVGRPAIVLADEPTGNLDSSTGASIMGLIRELNAAGATILIITHDADLADGLPRQIRVLDGQVVSDVRVAA